MMDTGILEWVRKKIHAYIQQKWDCRIAIHQPWYHRYTGYFYKMLTADIFLSLDIVQYVSRERQNRQAFYYNDALRRLTLPVWNKREPLSCKKILTPQIQKVHWQIIKMIYKHTPYFAHYESYFEDIYNKTHANLTDMCDSLTQMCSSLLGISTQYISVSSFYKKPDKDTPSDIPKKKAMLLIDIIETLVGRDMLPYITYLPRSAGDKNFYLEQRLGDDSLTEREKMEQSGIKVSYYTFRHPVYRQFQHADKKFIPNLSCIDLLCNCGPHARKVLEESGSMDHTNFSRIT